MSNTITPNNLAGLLNPQVDNSQKGLGAANVNNVLEAKSKQLDLSKQGDSNPSASGLKTTSLSEKFQAQYAYSQTMSLSLTTKEGDEVVVDFRQLYAEYQSYKQEKVAEEMPGGARYFESTEAMEATAFEERFGFSVQGHLNEDELGAIFQVFEQVDQLANEFYNGDIEQAFAKAQELDVNFNQLSSISLDLQKTEISATSYRQAATYQGVQETAGETAEDKANLADLPPYLQKWQAAIDTMSEHFESAREKFDEMMANVIEQREAIKNALSPEVGQQAEAPEREVTPWFDRIQSFHDSLAKMAELDTVTLKPSGVELPPLREGGSSVEPE